jgi:hypothetical protein
MFAKSPLRSLEPTAAFRRAVFLAAPVALVVAFVAAFFYHASPWYHERLAGTILVAAAVGGYVGTFTLLLSIYNRVVLLGLGGAVVCFALPIMSIFALLLLLKIPAETAPFWVALPAALVGEVLFECVKALHSRGRK